MTSAERRILETSCCVVGCGPMLKYGYDKRPRPGHHPYIAGPLRKSLVCIATEWFQQRANMFRGQDCRPGKLLDEQMADSVRFLFRALLGHIEYHGPYSLRIKYIPDTK